MRSKLFALNQRDVIRGVLVAALSAGAGSLVECMNKGTLLDTLNAVGAYALAAAIGYLIKNLLTNSSGEIGRGEK